MNWIFNNDPQQDKKRAYLLFGLVVAFYVACVVGYSFWSYNQHKKVMLAHTGAQLRNGVLALDVILGESVLKRAIAADAVTPEEYSALCKRMNAFASDCRFDTLGAFAITQRGTYTVVTGGRADTMPSLDSVPFWKPVSRKLLPFIKQAADATSGDPIICPLPYGDAGVFRSAILYRQTGPDTGYCIFTARNLDYLSAALRLQALRAITKGLFFLLMAYPLMLLYSITQQKSARVLTRLNEQLRNDVKKREKHENELKDAIRDLERFNAVAVGRENRIIELKAEVNGLLAEHGQPARYQAVPAAAPQTDSTENG